MGLEPSPSPTLPATFFLPLSVAGRGWPGCGRLAPVASAYVMLGLSLSLRPRSSAPGARHPQSMCPSETLPVLLKVSPPPPHRPCLCLPGKWGCPDLVS